MDKLDSIDFSDMQGLVRFAHAHLTQSCFLLLSVLDVAAAREWLTTAKITSATSATPIPDHALQVAFTATGMRALEIPAAVIEEFSTEFIEGIASDENRSRRLGDVGPNNPNNWDWGGAPSATPHLLVMLYARAGDMDAWQAQVQGNEFVRAFQVLAKLESTVPEPVEPFGFVDGISQPQIDWYGQTITDPHARDRYSNLLAVGEIVLGYRNEYGLYTSRPLLDPRSDPRAQQLPVAAEDPELRDLGRNGSYLVLRQLAQDVAGFWQYLDRAADGDSEARDRLAAAIVGRARDGTPLASRSPDPIPGIKRSGAHASLNHFTFDNDPHGTRCPIGAHVRRVNPRTGDFPVGVRGFFTRLIRTFGFARRHPHDDLVASARFHRLLRRGRVYGAPLSPEEAVKPDTAISDRGLQFIALGANISRQFEFVQGAWSMSAKFAGLANESDPLLGNREPGFNGDPPDTFKIPQATGPARCLSGLPQFVTVRGGAYFFMPGIKALHYIAGRSSTDAKG